MKTTALLALVLFAVGCKNPEAQPAPVEPVAPPVVAPAPPPPPAAPVIVTPDASVAAPPALDASAATNG